MVALSIRDFGGGKSPNGSASMSRTLLARSCPATSPSAFFDAPPIEQQFIEGEPGEWSKVSATLTQTELLVRSGDYEYRRQSRNQLLQSSRQLGFARAGFEALIPTFQTSEGIGIFSYSGPVGVRKARLELIDVR